MNEALGALQYSIRHGATIHAQRHSTCSRRAGFAPLALKAGQPVDDADAPLTLCFTLVLATIGFQSKAGDIS